MSDLLYKVQSRFLFHAHIRIKIPASCDDAVFDELFAVMESVDRKYNSYSPDSYIDRINKNAGHFVTVNDEMAAILEEIVFFSEIFKGAYDVTVMPLIRLWGFHRDRVNRIPSKQEISAIRSFVDYGKIEINGNEVKIGKGQEIVTGSFVKAYAVDRAVSRMKELGIDDAIVNAGGSTIYVLSPVSSDTWDIAVSDPAGDRSVYTFALANRCLSTSSQSETFVTVDGKHYGHILDPRTGYPSPNRLVCIASDRCMVGDIVSTGLFCETRDSFTEILDRISRKYTLEGFLIDPSGEPVCSSGFHYGYEKTAV